MRWFLGLSQACALDKVVSDEAVVLENDSVHDSVKVEVTAETDVSSDSVATELAIELLHLDIASV